MKSFLTFLWVLAAASALPQTLTLDEAVLHARDHRARIQSARLRLEEAQLAARALGALPTTILSLGYSTDPRVGGTDDDLVLSQPLDIFGRTSALRSSGDARILRARAELREAELDVQNDVIDIYVDSVAAQAKLVALRSAELSAEQLLSAVRGLVDGGKLPGVQATRVSIEVDRARAARKQQEAEVHALSRQLAAVLAVEQVSATADFPIISTPSVTTEDLLTRRADLAIFSSESAAAKAEYRIARASRSPQLELQARRSAWQDEDATYGARIQLSFPLFDSGRSRNEERSASKRAEAVSQELADLVRLASAEVDAALSQVEGAIQRVASLGTVLTTATALRERTESGLKEGANTLIDVLDAARAVQEISEELIDARADLARAQARYLRATGTLLQEVKP